MIHLVVGPYGVDDGVDDDTLNELCAGDRIADAGLARSPWRTANDVMAGMRSDDGQFVVLPPAGADRVRGPGATVEVKDRLARLPGPADGPVTLDALAPGGRVVERLTVDPG
jgi:hypothetical protein